MTSKEKSIELFNKMYNVDEYDDYNDPAMQYEHAKKCSLIAVDEIINTHQWGGGIAFDEKKFWEEVKHEIEQL